MPRTEHATVAGRYWYVVQVDDATNATVVAISAQDAPATILLLLSVDEVTQDFDKCVSEFLENATSFEGHPTADDWATWRHEWGYDDTAEHTRNYYRDLGVHRV